LERYLYDLIGKYRNGGVLVDTNLLVLLFVGAYDQKLIEPAPRLKDRFVPEDFDTLVNLLDKFRQLIVTPYVLAEVSNMLGYLREPARTECMQRFAHAAQVQMAESYESASNLSQNPSFLLFGITDASILNAAFGSHLVLTNDAPLYAYLLGQGVDVLNFNQIRPLNY